MTITYEKMVENLMLKSLNNIRPDMLLHLLQRFVVNMLHILPTVFRFIGNYILLKKQIGGCHGHDCMIVGFTGFTTINAISACNR